MSLWDRLVRALDALGGSPALDEGARWGALGEEQAEHVIQSADGCYVHNPVLPHPSRPGAFLESDFLVLTGGKLLVVEVKNYRGRIYQTRTEEQQVTRGWLFRRTEIERVPVIVPAGGEADELWQDKPGNYGEGVFTKSYRHPLKKTRSFIHHLKRYLSTIDGRFARMYITPVVAFGPEADLSEVHSFDAGMVYTSEIPAFLARHADPRFGGKPARWIVDGLARVPTWDRVLTTRGEWINGVITDPAFVFTHPTAGYCGISYAEIADIALERRGWLSAQDEVSIRRRSGQVEHIACTAGEVRLEHFGTLQRHSLRNLTRILPSLASLRPG